MGSPGLTAKVATSLPALGRLPIAIASGNSTQNQSSWPLPGPLSIPVIEPLIGGTTPPSAITPRLPAMASAQVSEALSGGVTAHSQSMASEASGLASSQSGPGSPGPYWSP